MIIIPLVFNFIKENTIEFKSAGFQSLALDWLHFAYLNGVE